MARTIGSNGEKTADNIRRVSLRLFAEQGYAAVSMRQIAKEVGIQAGALYNHFPNKQDILVELMASHMRALIGAWELAGKQFSSPQEALEGFVKFHISFHVDKPDEVFISYMELRNLDGDNFSHIESQRRLYEGFLRKVIQSGKTQGVFIVQDVPITSMAIIAMLTGLNTWYRTSGRLDVDQLQNIYVDLVRGAVGLSANNFKSIDIKHIENPSEIVKLDKGIFATPSFNSVTSEYTQPFMSVNTMV